MAILISIMAAIGAALLALAVLLAWPPVAPPAATAIGFEAAIGMDYADLPALQAMTMRDGNPLWYRDYAPAGAPATTLILVHGSAWHGMQFHALASAIAAAGAARVIVPDMRGHGENALRRGDLAHISQLEDDIADLIVGLRAGAMPGAIILAGHSSGGGFALRFAGGSHSALADGFVLLAPFLRYDAPTTRPNSGGWAYPSVPRIIALGLLNQLGITALNHLPVLAFAMPPQVLNGPLGASVTTQYSYAMQTGFAAHADYGADLAAAGRRLLVLVGADDEAFYPERYASLVAQHAPLAKVGLVHGAGHISLLSAAETATIIIKWLEDVRPASGTVEAISSPN